MSWKFWIRSVAVLSVSLFALMTGCDCQDTGGIGTTRTLEALPQALTFSALQGEEEVKTVRIRSRTGLIRIESIKIVKGSQHFTLLKDGLPSTPMDLNEGKSFILKVKYKAPGEGVFPVGTLRIVSDATTPNDGQLNVRLMASRNYAELVLTPDPVNFKQLKKGEEKIIEVTGKNDGSAVLEIQKIVKSDKNSPGFTFPDGLPKTPLILQPGKTFKFKVKYSPTNRKPDMGAVLFTCKGNCSPENVDPSRRKDPFILRLQGTLAVPSIAVNPKSLDFGFVDAGKMVKKSFNVSNIGGADLEIKEIVFKRGSSGAFSIPTINNILIKPGQTKKVPVEYRPSPKAPDQGTIEIKSNDPMRPVINFPVIGRIAAPDINVAPKKLNFGKVPIKKRLGITISNTGARPLILQPVSFAQGTSREFSFEKQPKILSIAPNKFTQIFVIYAPKDKIDDTGKVILKSNDPDEPVVEIPLQGQGSSVHGCDLVPFPSQVNFGLSVIGKSKIIPVKWVNQGALDCEVSRISVITDRTGFPPYSGPDAFYLPSLPKQCPKGVCNPPLKVTPGNSFSLNVSFAPLAEKKAGPWGKPEFTGSVLVDTNGNPARRTVILRGLATKSCVEVVPDNLNFGLVQVNCSSRNEKFTIYNTCPRSLDVTKIAFSSAGSNGFQIVKAPRVTFTIASGQSADIELKYRATAPARKQNAVLEIHHSVTQQSPLSIPLTAEGTTTADQTDTFQQLKSPKVDILFVIDDSGSMGNEQRSLGTNFAVFIKWALTLKVDFQIGITTTDIDGSNPFGGQKHTPGGLRGSPKIMTSHTPNLERIFRQNANVGTHGSATECGLEAAKLALSPPLSTTGANKGFLRKDASLSIITISDEPDQSTQPVQFYINFFRNIKGIRNPGMFRYNVVIGYDPVTKKNQCPANGQAQATSNGRYVAVANATNGVIASICNNNWASTLSKIGAVTFGLRKQFFLSRPADPKSIVIKVNGKVVSSGWTYSATDNSIVFKKAPNPGSTVQVHYKAICF